MPSVLTIPKLITAVLFTVFYVLFNTAAFGQNKKQNTSVNNSVTREFNELENHIKHIYNYEDNIKQLDSLCEHLLIWSADKPQEIQLKAIFNYFDHSNFAPPKSIELGKKAMRLSNQNLPSNYAVLSRIYLARAYADAQNITEAHTLLKDAILVASKNDEPFYLGFSQLEMGNLYSQKDQNKEAIRQYLSAMNLAEDHNNDSLYFLSCAYLSRFFFINKINSKAIAYSNLVLKNAEEKKDSNTVIWTLLNIQKIKGYQENIIEVDFNVMDEIISYADRKKNKKLSRYTFAIYRTLLTNKNKFKDLASLCLEKYPDRFRRLKQTEYHLYCRIRGLIFESRGQTDSAFYYFNLAKIEIEKETNAFMIAHFYQRYGEFLIRNELWQNAIIYFKKALNYFSSTSFELRSEQVSKAIELAYKNLGNHQEAYKYAILSREYYTAYLSQLESEELLNAEHDHEIENRKEESAQAEARRKKESEDERTKSTALSFGLALFLLLSGVSYYQFRLVRKERNKSNELLLNILPEATAEELKTEGKTSAKRYNNVTVLFADIKSFTLIAERLSPEDLVHQLDVYFTRFDEIVKANGLEKIKTIGDAYLAVGGLPEGNSATAQNVIKCSMEIMEYTKKEKAEKEVLGLPFFEIRIGINTGPVVAGVVGRDKFQYDIWGDAVNIAARMEQTSEVGKINVSRSTYLQIKDKCKCHFRGRLNAKNKGEIEMYFVEKG